MSPIAIQCPLCKEPASDEEMILDNDIRAEVCMDCVKDLHNAKSALTEARIRGVFRGTAGDNAAK